MMKNFKKFTAFVLALCMLLSLSVAAFAAETDLHTVYDSAPDEEIATQSESAVSGTIPGSKIRWELNEHKWLMISGSGDCEPFTSKDDQPWAAVRDQITQVWFDDMARGSSIRPASIGAQALAGTAVRRTTTTLRTA